MLGALMTTLSDFYAGKRVLLTGHTGFKGAWASHWLAAMGAKVAGYALPPDTTPSLFELARTHELVASTFGDIRDLKALSAVATAHEPEIVIHMAAQPLVRRSYREPLYTFETNVMGTANVLECVRALSSVRSIVIVTSDKCYENREQLEAYRETDAMGGHDPYSASKGAAELVTSAYRRSFFSERGVGVASARAGNVIGGGDWAEDRLIPDIVRGATRGEVVQIRNPRSTRPWQHVLEPVAGYLLLAKRLYEEPERFAGGWNFGPNEDEEGVPAGEVAMRFVSALGRGELQIATVDPNAPHEAKLLRLDSKKARGELGWHPKLDLAGALSMTAAFYRAHLERPGSERTTVDEQLLAYQS